jgi:hypothetical protein
MRVRMPPRSRRGSLLSERSLIRGNGRIPARRVQPAGPDRATGLTRRASTPPSGGQFLADARQTAISADGRYVAFVYTGDLDVPAAIYRRDLVTGTTELVVAATFRRRRGGSSRASSSRSRSAALWAGTR